MEKYYVKLFSQIQTLQTWEKPKPKPESESEPELELKLIPDPSDLLPLNSCEDLNSYFNTNQSFKTFVEFWFRIHQTPSLLPECVKTKENIERVGLLIESVSLASFHQIVDHEKPKGPLFWRETFKIINHYTEFRFGLYFLVTFKNFPFPLVLCHQAPWPEFLQLHLEPTLSLQHKSITLLHQEGTKINMVCLDSKPEESPLTHIETIETNSVEKSRLLFLLLKQNVVRPSISVCSRDETKLKFDYHPVRVPDYLCDDPDINYHFDQDVQTYLGPSSVCLSVPHCLVFKVPDTLPTEEFIINSFDSYPITLPVIDLGGPLDFELLSLLAMETQINILTLVRSESPVKALVPIHQHRIKDLPPYSHRPMEFLRQINAKAICFDSENPDSQDLLKHHTVVHEAHTEGDKKLVLEKGGSNLIFSRKQIDRFGMLPLLKAMIKFNKNKLFTDYFPSEDDPLATQEVIYFFVEDSPLPYFCCGGYLFWRLLLNKRNLLENPSKFPIFFLPEKSGQHHDLVVFQGQGDLKTVSPQLFAYSKTKSQIFVIDSQGNEYEMVMPSLLCGKGRFSRILLFIHLWEKLFQTHFLEHLKNDSDQIKLVHAYDQEKEINYLFFAPKNFQKDDCCVCFNFNNLKNLKNSKDSKVYKFKFNFTSSKVVVYSKQ